jgi:hypothetical protein
MPSPRHKDAPARIAVIALALASLSCVIVASVSAGCSRSELELLDVPSDDLPDAAGPLRPQDGAADATQVAETGPDDGAPRDELTPPLDGGNEAEPANDGSGIADAACTLPLLQDADVPDGGLIAAWADSVEVQIVAIARDRLGNTFATGFAGSGPMYLGKFDLAGNLVWSKTFGDYYVEPGDLDVDATGAVIVAGMTGAGSSYDFGGGNAPPGGFLVKLDGNGAFLWQRIWPYATSSYAYPEHVRALSNGALLVAGDLQGSVDLGTGTLTAGGGSSVFVARFDPCGNTLSSYEYGGLGKQYALGLAVAPGDEGYLVGTVSGTIDFGQGPLSAPESGYATVIAKLDPSNSGAIASRLLPGSGPATRPGFPAVDGAGNLVVVGTFDDTIDLGSGPVVTRGGEDIFLAKLSPTLVTIWGETFGDPSDQEGFSVASDPSGDIFLTGGVGGEVPFGSGTLDGPPDAAAGITQLFVARVASDGTPLSGEVAVAEGDEGVSYGFSVLADGTGAAVVGGAYYAESFALGPASFPLGSGGVVVRFRP